MTNDKSDKLTDGSHMAPDDDQQEIDLLELARKLWNGRRTLLRWAIYGAVAGIVIAFSIPKE